jgi:hypothetical protein
VIVRILARERGDEAVDVLGQPDLLQTDHVGIEPRQVSLDRVETLLGIGREPDTQRRVEADEREFDHRRLLPFGIAATVQQQQSDGADRGQLAKPHDQSLAEPARPRQAHPSLLALLAVSRPAAPRCSLSRNPAALK